MQPLQPNSIFFPFQTFALVCQLLLFFFGMKHSFQMSGGGMTYFIFMTTSSGCLLNSLVLIASYVLSPRTRALIRPTIFVSIFQRCAILSMDLLMTSAIVSFNLYFIDCILEHFMLFAVKMTSHN